MELIHFVYQVLSKGNFFPVEKIRGLGTRFPGSQILLSRETPFTVLGPVKSIFPRNVVAQSDVCISEF
jgi:hypothetical protein